MIITTLIIPSIILRVNGYVIVFGAWSLQERVNRRRTGGLATAKFTLCGWLQAELFWCFDWDSRPSWIVLETRQRCRYGKPGITVVKPYSVCFMSRSAICKSATCNSSYRGYVRSFLCPFVTCHYWLKTNNRGYHEVFTICSPGTLVFLRPTFVT